MLITNINHHAASIAPRDRLADVTEDAAADLAEQIRARGYGELTGLFSPAELDEARAQAEAAVTTAGGGYAGLDETAGLHGAILRDLADSAALADICRALFVRVYGGAAPTFRFGQILRCLSGRSGRRHNLYFHYDSYALTVIVPVAIPAVGRTGDLLLWPDARGVRRSYLLNAAEKFVADRRVVQALLAWLARRSRSLVRLRLVPGNLYVFCGYRALHANEPVDADALRATLVLHCIDVHAAAVSRRLFGRVRRALGRRPATAAV